MILQHIKKMPSLLRRHAIKLLRFFSYLAYLSEKMECFFFNSIFLKPNEKYRGDVPVVGQYQLHDS